MSDQPPVRPSPVSGFPEWLPHVRLVEQRRLDDIRAAFERYGFCSIETPAVERMDVLLSKGDTSNEVYTLARAQSSPDQGADDNRLGLHFDLTVPFARYTAQHFNDLVFPFKRYQIQRAWRGERPQDGRFREFTQCDIDVINLDQTPIHFDAELPRIVHEVLTSLDLPPWTLNVNNRKVLQGFYEGLGIADPLAVIRTVDKVDKIGLDGVASALSDILRPAQLESVLELAQLRSGGPDDVRGLGVRSPLLDEGLDELDFVLRELSDLPEVVADFSVARGLDYYTGTVYEGKFVDWPEYGAICSGGRYDDLAGSFIRRKLPGVGMSIGFSRIFAKMLSAGLVEPGPSTPADILVVLPKDRRPTATTTARTLRDNGFNVELYHQEDKVAKQVRYASRKGIPFVWFPPFEDGRPHEVKDLATGVQTTADPTTWSRDTA